MWHPSAAVTATHAHVSGAGYTRQDAAAAFQRNQYAQLQHKVNASQGRIGEFEVAAAAATIHRNITMAPSDRAHHSRSAGGDEEERFRTGRVVLPSDVMAAQREERDAATSRGASQSGIEASLVEPSAAPHGSSPRGRSSQGQRETKAAAMREARLRRAAAAEAARPATSPYGQLVFDERRNWGSNCSDSPIPDVPRQPVRVAAGVAAASAPTTPIGLTPRPPSTAAASSARAGTSHHFRALTSVGSARSHQPGAQGAQRPQSSPDTKRAPTSSSIPLSLGGGGASPLQTALAIQRLHKGARKEMYKRRYDAKVRQVLGTRDESVTTAGWEAAEEALRIASQRAPFAMPKPWNPREEEEKQIQEAEMYYRMSVELEQHDLNQQRQQQQQLVVQQRPRTSPASLRRPGTGDGSVTVRGAQMQTDAQLFRQELRSAYQPDTAHSPAVHSGMPDRGALRSVDLHAPTHSASSILSARPASSSSGVVSSLTAPQHWSNRIFTHVPDAVLLTHQVAAREQKKRNAREIQHKFQTFQQEVRKGLADPAHVAAGPAASLVNAAAQGDASTTPPLSSAAAVFSSPADFIRTACSSPSRKRSSLSTASLSDFDEQVDATFAELLLHTHAQAHSSSFDAGLVCQRLNLLATDVNRQNVVAGVHDRMALMKHQWVANQREKDKQIRRDQQRTMDKHWRTGLMEREQEDEAGERKSVQTADPNDPIEQQKRRHLEHFLSVAASEAAQLQQDRLAAEQRDELRKAAAAESTAAAAQVAANALEADYALGAIQRPEAVAAATEALSTSAGAFSAALQSALSTQAFLEQRLPDQARPDKATRVAAESAESRRTRQEEREERRRTRHEMRAVRRQRRELGADVSSSSSDPSDEDDSDTEQRKRQPPALLQPATNPSSRLAQQHARQAAAALEPVTALLSSHSVHARATDMLDATAAAMRKARAQVERAEAERLAQLALQHDLDAEAQRRKDMAALLRLEHNQRAIKATQRNMERKGSVQLSLLGLLHGHTSDSSVQSVLSLVPEGHVCRFEVRLMYASPDLPQLVAHTLPFSASTAAATTTEGNAAGMTEILQCIRFPVLNAHVQRFVVTMQALSGRQLLQWLFQHRHALFGAAGGLDHDLSALDASLRMGLLSPSTSTADGKPSQTPCLADYLRFCDAELTAVSARSPQSWCPTTPKKAALLQEAHTPQLMLMPPSSAAPSPRGELSARTTSQALTKRAASAPRSANARSGMQSSSTDAESLLGRYEQSLSSWFAQGAPSPRAEAASNGAPTPSTGDFMQPSPPISLSQRSRIIQAHTAASTELETFGGWLQALRARKAAVAERAKNPLAANEVADAAEAELASGGRVGQRLKVIASWSAEQVSMWLDAVGIVEPVALLRQRHAFDGAALLAAATEVARIAKHAGDVDELFAALAVAKTEKQPREHALRVGNQQRTADAVQLHRCLSLLTHAAPVVLTDRFDMDAMSLLRAQVLAAFHKVNNLPQYVAAEAMRQDELEAAATTDALTPEEQAALNARLTAHNNRMTDKLAARTQPMHAPAVDLSLLGVAAQTDARGHHQPTKSLLHSQLHVMEILPASVAAAYRTKHGKQHRSTVGVTVEEVAEHSDGGGEESLSPFRTPTVSRRSILSHDSSPVGSEGSTRKTPSALIARPASAALALFQSPPSAVNHTSRIPSAAAAAAAQPRLQPQTDHILLLGCFDLPLRRVANAPDGILRTALRLRPVEDVAHPETPLKATPRPSSGSGLTPSSALRPPVTHYRSDMTTQLHSFSPRTFMVPSSVPSTARPLTAPEQPRSQAVPPLVLTTEDNVAGTSASSPSVSNKRVPMVLRSVLARDARQAATDCIRSARVEIEAIFTAPYDAFDA